MVSRLSVVADQDDAVERDSAVDQVSREARGAKCPVAFSGDEQRGELAVVARNVHPDEFADRLDIALHSVHAAGHFHRLCAAVARAHRIDEDQVRIVEPRVLVVLHAVGRLQHAAVGLQHRAARTHAAHVHPHRCRSRPAVEAEGERALGGIGDSVLGVSDVKDVCLRLARRILQRHLCDGGRVVQALAVDVDRVFRDYRSLVHVPADGGSWPCHSAAAAASSGSGLRRRGRFPLRRLGLCALPALCARGR